MVSIDGVHVSISYGIATKDKKEQNDDFNKLSDEAMYIDKFAETSVKRRAIVKEILQVIYDKYEYEQEHTMKTKVVATLIGEQLKLPKEEMENLSLISELHDIGKIAIDASILNKKGSLDEYEWDLIHKHPEKGYRILIASLEYMHIADDVFAHHEWFDGNGYPRKLKGNRIPLRARIICLADAYAAMVSERSYKTKMSHEEVVLEIKKYAGTQFDPKIVEAFLVICDQIKQTLDRTPLENDGSVR